MGYKCSSCVELLTIGYGMLDGKVADPEDPYHSYMLNAYGYAGLYGAGQVFKAIGSPYYEHISKAAEELRENIKKTVSKSFADAPVVPCGNGSWCPSISPWAEYRGPY